MRNNGKLGTPLQVMVAPAVEQVAIAAGLITPAHNKAITIRLKGLYSVIILISLDTVLIGNEDAPLLCEVLPPVRAFSCATTQIFNAEFHMTL
nr:hypothetical protein [Acinetobacter silvestris]